jgi:hypothetical protein
MKKRHIVPVIAVTVLAGAPFMVPVFSPWSRINCEEQEIDLESGKERITKFVYWIPIQRQIGDTTLSLELSKFISTGKEPQWEPVITAGPYVKYSPHYVYHSAFNQIKVLGLNWDEFAFDSAMRQKTGLGLLHEWQVTTTDSSADDYLRNLTEKAEKSASPDPH